MEDLESWKDYKYIYFAHEHIYTNSGDYIDENSIARHISMKYNTTWLLLHNSFLATTQARIKLVNLYNYLVLKIESQKCWFMQII